MSISYAGIDLLHATDEIRDWVRQNIDPAELLQFGYRHRRGASLSLLGYRQEAAPKKVELNCLHWPTGASRFGVGWYLADQGLLDLIRAETIVDGGLLEADLVLSDGYDSLTASMWMLPAVPLQMIGADGLYVVTLVDERYYWWYRAAAISVTSSTTWSLLYASIASALDITLTVDSVEAAYLTPPTSLGTQYEYLPLLLEAVANSTGRKIVRQLDGTVRAWKPENALTQQETSIAAIEDKLAGGLAAIGEPDDDSVGDEDNPALVPESVTVAFRRSDSGYLVAAKHAEQIDLADLALDEFPGTIGFTGSKIFHAGAVALYPGPSNATELEDLAERIATDWYRWQLGKVSLSLIGYPGWTLTGLEDALILRHENGRVLTRILPGAADADGIGELHYDADYAEACGCVTTVTPIDGPPPWEEPTDPPPVINQFFFDGTFLSIWNGDTFIYFCPCDPYEPGPGSGSGYPAVCGDCTACPDGAPFVWTFQQTAAIGAFADGLGEWNLEWDSGCTWTQTRGAVTCTLEYDVTDGWLLTFTSGAYIEIMAPYHTSFLCCGETRFVQLPYTGSGQNLNSSNHTDDFADLQPGSVCGPCEEGGGGESGITVACCHLPVAATLYATFSGGSGDCACLNSVPTITLTYDDDPLVQAWVGTYTACSTGDTYPIRFACSVSGWGISGAIGLFGCFTTGVEDVSDCAGFEVSFNATAQEPCCTGSFVVTVTD